MNDIHLRNNAKTDCFAKFNLTQSALPSTHLYEETKNDCQSLNFPFVKRTEGELLLPQYFEVLDRSANCSVKIDDLDKLQCDLEKLLSACVVRKTILMSEVEAENDQERDSCCEKQKNVGHGSLVQQTVHPIIVNDNKLIKTKVWPSTGKSITRLSIPSFHENTVARSFWSFTEPYVAKVTEIDLSFIDKLIQETRNTIYARRTQFDKQILRKCSRLQNLTQMKGIHDQIINKTMRQNIRQKNAISAEIQKCVKELTSISKNNFFQLYKVREKAIKDLYYR